MRERGTSYTPTLMRPVDQSNDTEWRGALYWDTQTLLIAYGMFYLCTGRMMLFADSDRVHLCGSSTSAGVYCCSACGSVSSMASCSVRRLRSVWSSVEAYAYRHADHWRICWYSLALSPILGRSLMLTTWPILSVRDRASYRRPHVHSLGTSRRSHRATVNCRQLLAYSTCCWS